MVLIAITAESDKDMTTCLLQKSKHIVTFYEQRKGNYTYLDFCMFICYIIFIAEHVMLYHKAHSINLIKALEARQVKKNRIRKVVKNEDSRRWRLKKI